MRYTPTQYAHALRDLAREAPLAKRRGMVREFLAAVAKNGSLSLLPEIAREYEALLDREKKLRHVTVRAPERLSEGSVARKLRFKAKVKSVRDVRLLGGAVIEVGDLRVDNSVARRLGRIRSALTTQVLICE